MSALSTLQSDPDRFLAALARLPALPRSIVYDDDFEECKRTVKTEEVTSVLKLFNSGQRRTVYLSCFSERIRPLMRHFLLRTLSEKSAATVLGTAQGLARLDPHHIERLSTESPLEARATWHSCGATSSSRLAEHLKTLLNYFCDIGFGEWTPAYRSFVLKALEAPRRDHYATVRSGDSFLTLEEETRLVRWIDQAAAECERLSLDDLTKACLVLCAYQFGVRPKQLAMVRTRDIAYRRSTEDGSDIVHVTFKLMKQRDLTLANLTLRRKVKREWAPLFVRRMALQSHLGEGEFWFGFPSRRMLTLSLGKWFESIFHTSGRTAYDLRHTLAQRMVDAGASHEELAAALGQTDLTSGLVYFASSANQAELVNRALGLSETYQTVARISKERFITEEELGGLKGEQQVGGMPHGLPISGIGGCETGQPSCPYNPITACYGCPKFMPVRDLELHRTVLAEFRSIVTLYHGAGKGDGASPAYLQLQRSIGEVQAVIQQLEGGHAE